MVRLIIALVHLLPLDEAEASRAIFVIASGSDGRKRPKTKHETLILFNMSKTLIESTADLTVIQRRHRRQIPQHQQYGTRNGCVADKVQVSVAFHPSRVDKSSTSFGCTYGRYVASVGWCVKLSDPT